MSGRRRQPKIALTRLLLEDFDILDFSVDETMEDNCDTVAQIVHFTEAHISGPYSHLEWAPMKELAKCLQQVLEAAKNEAEMSELYRLADAVRLEFNSYKRRWIVLKKMSGGKSTFETDVRKLVEAESKLEDAIAAFWKSHDGTSAAHSPGGHGASPDDQLPRASPSPVAESGSIGFASSIAGSGERKSSVFDPWDIGAALNRIDQEWKRAQPDKDTTPGDDAGT